MTYTVTPLGLQLPDPGSGQAWQTAVYNGNLQKLEDAIAAAAGSPKSRENMLYASTTSPALGSTGYSRAYWTIAGGFCIVQFSVYWSSGAPNASKGSGNWGLRLPVPLATGNGGRFTLNGFYQRNTPGVNGFPLFATMDNGDTGNANQLFSADGARISDAISNIGVNGDRMFLQGAYPIAVAPAG